MGFGFRVGVPGMSVRVSSRGVRTSVGPRVARVHRGAGRTRVSSGMGPFFASTSVGGGRRAAAKRPARSRPPGPTPAQLERARRQVHRRLRDAAAHWWNALNGNDEETVCEAVNTAFADNPAAVSINMDVDTGLTCASLAYATLSVQCATGAAWTFRPPSDPAVRAMVMAEF
ncbi:DUF4236 domain-containing protein [Actinomadura chibensis]|uniref:DUF4236 domain-containing protein n=1 Tax=Actinomadura chibensis TaxID=392828 RepID=A0A5D0NNV0_9ACTN|nr:DUF4236 domain-containing protein [Actinomadura chibensis]TYB46147.1 DUF4236 domain-containing protein [Actinomadura chibensis]